MAKAKKLERLGLVEFLEQQQMPEHAGSVAQEEKPVCPSCGSSLIQPITNALRCGACGHQFGLERNPIGARARAPKVGWPANRPTNSV